LNEDAPTFQTGRIGLEEHWTMTQGREEKKEEKSMEHPHWGERVVRCPRRRTIARFNAKYGHPNKKKRKKRGRTPKGIPQDCVKTPGGAI